MFVVEYTIYSITFRIYTILIFSSKTFVVEWMGGGWTHWILDFRPKQKQTRERWLDGGREKANKKSVHRLWPNLSVIVLCSLYTLGHTATQMKRNTMPRVYSRFNGGAYTTLYHSDRQKLIVGWTHPATTICVREPCMRYSFKKNFFGFKVSSEWCYHRRRRPRSRPRRHCCCFCRFLWFRVYYGLVKRHISIGNAWAHIKQFRWTNKQQQLHQKMPSHVLTMTERERRARGASERKNRTEKKLLQSWSSCCTFYVFLYQYKRHRSLSHTYTHAHSRIHRYTFVFNSLSHVKCGE